MLQLAQYNKLYKAVIAMATDKKIPHVLIIMDGVGERETTQDNAVKLAHTPTLDHLKDTCPHGLLSASGLDVGLPPGQFGNSEVGHMHLGAGRILYQDSTKISQAIADESFFDNNVLCTAIDATIAVEGAVQVLGLLSDGGVHAHETHIVALCRLALMRGAPQVYIHAFLDGRDTPPKSADTYLARLETQISALNSEFTGTVAIASIVGRFYALDRDRRWERVQQAYDLLTTATAKFDAKDSLSALNDAYARGESDEFVAPTIIDDNGVICDNDGVLFANFRADRARELSEALLMDDFTGFTRKTKPALATFVSLTHYSDVISAHPTVGVAYPPTSLVNTLGEYLAKQGKTQLRLAETEKYPHVSFFFSGGQEAVFDGETRILVDSPKVETYDMCPQMSAHAITERLLAALDGGAYDVIVVNYANGDMVGHTGDLAAAIAAVETVDNCLDKVVAKIQALDGVALITADHGNCEQMFDYVSNQVHTQHTTELVPFIYVGNETFAIRQGGRLCDVAPTLLQLLGLAKPDEMTGESLLLRGV